GTNVLVGEDPERLAKAVEDMVNGNWKNSGIPDRWDGRSAERILRILSEIKSN
ncbi:MAG: UDP-N-acetylglucosamine 2-epimerase (non-hydrolyzing), partial [Prevotella sp.]